MEFMIRRDGRDLGPYSEVEVRTRLLAGTFALSDLGLADGATEWASLSAFPQFATSYREPPFPPPIPAPAAQHLGSYTTATLQPNERPLHQTTIHWMALSGSVIGAVLSL